MNKTHRLQTSTEPLQREPRDWSDFHAELPLTRTQAFDLCKTLASTPGTQPVWRVLDPSDHQVLLIAGGARS